MLTPVHDDAGEFVGVIRITYRFATIAEDLMQLRYLVVGCCCSVWLAGRSWGMCWPLTRTNLSGALTNDV
ncbi:MAG: hypothetical protein IPK53_09645 [bacterium]|nr:hypothetical protein [bacterium]